ncbi:hypothetical protein D9M69_720220 [compost metagenome]
MRANRGHGPLLQKRQSYSQGSPLVSSFTGNRCCIPALASRCALTGAVMKRNTVISTSCRLMLSPRLLKYTSEAISTPPTPRVAALVGACRRV